MNLKSVKNQQYWKRNSDLFAIFAIRQMKISTGQWLYLFFILVSQFWYPVNLTTIKGKQYSANVSIYNTMITFITILLAYLRYIVMYGGNEYPANANNSIRTIKLNTIQTNGVFKIQRHMRRKECPVNSASERLNSILFKLLAYLLFKLPVICTWRQSNLFILCGCPCPPNKRHTLKYKCFELKVHTCRCLYNA